MNKPADFVFTPTTKAPEPELGFERIPVDRYTDPMFIKLEDDCIWSKTWLLAGAACDVASPVIFCFRKPSRVSACDPRRGWRCSRVLQRLPAQGKSLKASGVEIPLTKLWLHGWEYIWMAVSKDTRGA